MFCVQNPAIILNIRSAICIAEFAYQYCCTMFVPGVTPLERFRTSDVYQQRLRSSYK